MAARTLAATSVGDTIGPGGLFKALRTVPAVKELDNSLDPLRTPSLTESLSPVLADKIFGGDVTGCKSMPGRNFVRNYDRLAVRQGKRQPGARRGLDDGNIVVGVDDDRVIADWNCHVYISIQHKFNNYVSKSGKMYDLTFG